MFALTQYNVSLKTNNNKIKIKINNTQQKGETEDMLM